MLTTPAPRRLRSPLPIAPLHFALLLALSVALLALPTVSIADRSESELEKLRHGGANERRDAALWLGENGKSAAVPELVKALRDRDRMVRMLSENSIWSIWLRSGNEEIAGHLLEGAEHLRATRYAEAVKAFDRVVATDGEFAEGYNKRATALYYLGDFEGSMADIRETLKRNPYHFGALSGAGLCMMALEDPAAALQYFERALEINPNMPGVVRMARRLRRDLATKML